MLSISSRSTQAGQGSLRLRLLFSRAKICDVDDRMLLSTIVCWENLSRLPAAGRTGARTSRFPRSRHNDGVDISGPGTLKVGFSGGIETYLSGWNQIGRV